MEDTSSMLLSYRDMSICLLMQWFCACSEVPPGLCQCRPDQIFCCVSTLLEKVS